MLLDFQIADNLNTAEWFDNKAHVVVNTAFGVKLTPDGWQFVDRECFTRCFVLAVVPFTLELSQPKWLLTMIAMQLNKMEATDQQQLACHTKAYCKAETT